MMPVIQAIGHDIGFGCSVTLGLVENLVIDEFLSLEC